MSEPTLALPAPKLTAVQATLASLAVGLPLTVAALLVAVGYRDTTLGLLSLGAVAGLGLITAIILRPHWGAYLLIVTLALNLSALFTDRGLPSINRPLIALVVVSFGLNRLLLWNRRPLKLRFGRTEGLIIVYAFIWFLSILVAEDRALAFSLTVDLVKDVAIILCLVYALRNAHQWRQGAWILIGAITAVAVLSALQALTGGAGQSFAGLVQGYEDQVTEGVFQIRQGGPIGRANFFGQILVAYLVLVVYRILFARRWSVRIAATLAAGALLVATIYTYSRGAFVTLLAVAGLVTLERRVRPGLLLLAALLLLLVLRLLPAGYSERLDSLTNISFGREASNVVYTESSLRGRLSEVGAGLLMFAEHPVLGVGVGNYNRHYQRYASRIGLEYRTTERDAHSLIVEIAAETGVFGLFIFGGIVLSLQWDLYRARRRLAGRNWGHALAPWTIAFQLAIVAYMISSLFLHGDFFRYFWLLVALSAALVHIIRENTADPPVAPAVEGAA